MRGCGRAEDSFLHHDSCLFCGLRRHPGPVSGHGSVVTGSGSAPTALMEPRTEG